MQCIENAAESQINGLCECVEGWKGPNCDESDTPCDPICDGCSPDDPSNCD